MKTFALSLLLLPGFALGAEKFRADPALLLPAATKKSEGRSIASPGKAQPDSNEDIFQELPVGAEAMIQNSFGKLNNQVVRVVAIYDDKRLQVKAEDGSVHYVLFKNLAKNLSPGAACGESLGTQICKGDKVLYGRASASMMIPEAEVRQVFKNNHAILRDGTDFEVELNAVGKEAECSPQKPSLCAGAPVLAEGYKNGERYVFEGNIEKTYSHGVVLVRALPTLLIPIDAMAVKKRLAKEAVIDDPAVMSNHGFRNKPSYTVLPELEPLDPATADRAKAAH